jgi:hypothetical protein
MNATVQVLRAIPELQTALHASVPPPTDISSALRDLFVSMDRTKGTKGTVTPTDLLQQLRLVVPQFGVMGSNGTHYAQQGQFVSSAVCCLAFPCRVPPLELSLTPDTYVLQFRCGRVLDADYRFAEGCSDVT